MTKLKIIVEIEDVEPTLVDPMEAGDAILNPEGAFELLDAEWVEEFRNGRTPGGKFEPEGAA